MTQTETGVKPETPKTTPYCSFCGKSNLQVHTLIAGPQAYVCNECVYVCVEIISKRLDGNSALSNFLDARFNIGALSRLESIELSSIEELFAEGGLTKKDNLYTAKELLLAFIRGLEFRLKPPEDAQLRANAIESIKARIEEINSQANPLLEQLRRLELGEPVDLVLGEDSKNE